MKLNRGVLAICILLSVWGGFFCLFPASASAYGGGTQAERFPQTVTAAQFAAYAQEKLEQELAARGEARRHTLTLTRAVAAMHAPAGALICEVEVPGVIRYGRLTPVYVRVYVNGKFYRRAILYYRVEVYDTVLTAAHDLRPDQKIGAEDVRQADIAVEDAGTVYLKELAEVEGRVPARFLKTGTPLSADVLQAARVLEAGDPVTLVTRYHGIEVKVEGVALQRGRIGERIRVRNTRSAKVLMGTVLDAHTVQVGSDD